MKILICTFSFPSLKHNFHDGKFVYSEAYAYAENGAQVRVLTPHYFEADPRENIKNNLSVYRFRYFFPARLQVLKRPGIPIYNQRSLLALIQIPLICLFFSFHILRHAIWADIIHAQWTITALLALPAKFLLNKKLVVTVRGSDLRLFPKWLNRFIHRRVDGAIDCFGPQPWNEEYKNDFPAHYIKLPLLVYSPQGKRMPDDMADALDVMSPDCFIVLYIGRFDQLKIDTNKLPIYDLIEAASILKRRGLHFHVFYIGNGNSDIELKMKDIIKTNGLGELVTLLGPKTNVSEYITYCDLGVGGVALNAVSQEFTINSIPQLLVDSADNENTPWIDGQNSIFFTPGSVTDLASKIFAAAQNRATLKKKGARASRDLSELIADSKDGGKTYIMAFRELMNGHGSTSNENRKQPAA